MANDFIGLGKMVHGLVKLSESIKGYFSYYGDYKRFENVVNKIEKGTLKPNSLSFKTPHLEVGLNGIGYTGTINEESINQAANYQEHAVEMQKRQTARQQLNIDKTICQAAEYLKETEQVSSEEIDEEWLSTFFENAKYANSEYMQRLWAHILAGKIQDPSSISLLTLNTLKLLDKKDAERFTAICSLLLSSIREEKVPFVIHDSEYLKNKFGILHQELECFEELGLIKLQPYDVPDGITLVDRKTAIFIYANKLFFEFMYKKINYLRFFSLTRLGLELSKIARTEQIHEDYLDVIKKHFCADTTDASGELFISDFLGFKAEGNTKIPLRGQNRIRL